MSRLLRSLSDSAEKWGNSTHARVKSANNAACVWTVVWPLWPLLDTVTTAGGGSSGSSCYHPPLLWLRHDRTPLDQYVILMLGNKVLYQSIRKGMRSTSDGGPLVLAPGCSRQLGQRDGQQLETLTLRVFLYFKSTTLD